MQARTQGSVIGEGAVRTLSQHCASESQVSSGSNREHSSLLLTHEEAGTNAEKDGADDRDSWLEVGAAEDLKEDRH